MFMMPVVLTFASLTSPVVGVGEGGEAEATGTVVDAEGNPAAGADLFLSAGYAPDGSVPVIARAVADERGRFAIALPDRERYLDFIWTPSLIAYRPGHAPAAVTFALNDPPAGPIELTLPPEAGRSAEVRNEAGDPIEGVAVAPRRIFRADLRSWAAVVPDELAERLAGRSGADGRATLRGLAADDRLWSARVDVPGRFSGVVPVEAERAEVVPIALGKGAALAGSVHDRDGRPMAGVAVEVWAEGQGSTPITPVAFADGPVLTDATGAFRTPAALLDGSRYRAVVRPEGAEPTFSRWVAVDPDGTPPVELTVRSLRTVTGRVVDLRGEPIAGASVFQRGDGPRPTDATTDRDGRFTLPGFASGPVFVFARADGRRFSGRLIDEGEPVEGVEIRLIRVDEPAPESMTTLPPALGREARVALARQVLQPYLERAIASEEEANKFWLFNTLREIDPIEALETLEQTHLAWDSLRPTILSYVARSLLREDPDEAAALAASIEDHGSQAEALVDLVDRLPESDRDRRLALLDRATLQARATAEPGDRLYLLGDVAERYFELGERQKANALYAEAKAIDGQLEPSNHLRGYFAIRLARVDLPAALEILETVEEPRTPGEYHYNIAARLADEDPEAAERVLRLIDDPIGRAIGAPRACEKMAPVDPERARRVAELADGTHLEAVAWMFLARGLKGHDDDAAAEAFRAACERMDRAIDAPGAGLGPFIPAEALLPVVEELDPSWVPEVFWRAVASRTPSCDPRRPVGSIAPYTMALLLARYDHEVAAALFSPADRALDDPGAEDDPGLMELLVLSVIDPGRAAALAAELPPEPTVAPDGTNWSRLRLAEALAQRTEDFWKGVWRTHSGLGGLLFDRDLW